MKDPGEHWNTEAIAIKDVRVAAYTIPTETPEADGTLEWNDTTMVTVHLDAGNYTGFGYTYANCAAAFFIHKKLAALLKGQNAFDIASINEKLVSAIRNNGNTGLAMMAVSAVDNALWDLKGKLLQVPLCRLLGHANQGMLLYGSGGFTNYSEKQLQDQFTHFAKQGMTHLKMKTGSKPNNDVDRVRQAREVLDKDVKLMIDANGAYSVKQALDIAQQVKEFNVTWFEEPVSSDNVEGLQYIAGHAPAGMNIAAGEYGYNLYDFKHLLQHRAVNVLQADATRCGGITGFLKAGHLAEAWQVPFSSHCAPALHLHAALALPSFYIAEYFYDHVRIENLLFDGMPSPKEGCLYPDLSRSGMGIELKEKDAAKFKVY